MFRMKCFLPGVGGVVCGISPEVCAHIHTSCEHVNTGLAIKKYSHSSVMSGVVKNGEEFSGAARL